MVAFSNMHAARSGVECTTPTMQAVEYRKLADAAEDPAAKKEFLELAEACEEAADKDRRLSS